MNYERLILQILAEAGQDGLSVKKIARHVYNATNGFFSEEAYDDVHLRVRQYLQRQTARKNGFVRRLSHGVYQLDLKTKEARQLMLQFKKKDEPARQQPTEDKSLSLF